MFALLIPLVLNLAPQLAGLIFGSKGADATTKVAAVVQTVVGHAGRSQRAGRRRRRGRPHPGQSAGFR